MFKNQLKPENYIRQKARSLPLYQCLLNPDWHDKGLATIAISRKQPSGKFIVGIYLVDVFCLGLKNTGWHFSLDDFEFEDLIAKLNEANDIEEAEYELCHNIIYGAIEYADELGFKPQKDFTVSQFILDDDENEDIELMAIEFGKNGKPFYVEGPHDNADHILKTLSNKLGVDGFTFISKYDFDDEFEDEFGDEFEEEDDDDDDEYDAYEDIIERDDIVMEDGAIVTFSFLDVLTRMPEYFVYKEHETKIKNENDDFRKIKLLKQLIHEYPGSTKFHSDLIEAYIRMEMQEEVKKATIEFYEKFPHYLFAKTSRALMAINNNQSELIPEIFENKFEITELYADVDKFYFQEYLVFSGVMTKYFSLTGDLEKAQMYYQRMVQVDEFNDITLSAAKTYMSESLKRKTNPETVTAASALADKIARSDFNPFS